MLHGGFLLFNSAYFGHARSFIQIGRKLIELVSSADRIDVHTTVVFVAHPPAYTDRGRVFFYKPAEPDALHAA